MNRSDDPARSGLRQELEQAEKELEEQAMIDRESLLHHCRLIREGMRESNVIPFLGAAVNTYSRQKKERDWYERGHLPKTDELARRLADKYDYPMRAKRDPLPLVGVAQYVDVATGADVLDRELRRTFTREYVPSVLLEFLAEEQTTPLEGSAPPWKLLVTTNYDDALEQAFRHAGVEFDLVYYWAPHDRPGKFRHVDPEGKARTITNHNHDRSLKLGRRPVILKIHGTVDRRHARNDCYVIRENDYIAYLARDLARFLPAPIARVMRSSRFLFLGYSLSDWNLRVMLFHHLWARRERVTSWAIQHRPSEIDRTFWTRKEVELLAVELQHWVNAMRELRA
jgi:hypothetical protein